LFKTPIMKCPLYILISILLANLLHAQDSLVVDAELPDSEFHVAINPTDSNNIIIATMHGGTTGDMKVYYTFDQGDSWQTSPFTGVHPGYQGAGDPVLDFDASGNAYLINLTISVGFSTVISKSTDGGATWQLETDITQLSTDKPWLAIDRYDNSPYRGNIYLPFVNALLNEPVLLTFDSTLTQTSQVTAGPNEHQPGIAIRKDGEIFMSMVDWGSPNQIFMAQYTDGGTTLVHKTFLTSFPNYRLNAPDVSLRYQPTVYTAIDNSGGPYDGRLYVAYTASESADPSIFDVFVMYSDDGGLSWSDPSTVHSNGEDGKQQYYSSLYVNNQGVLVIDWYDRRNYPSGSSNTDFYLGISTDGGSSFSEIQLNSVSMDWQFANEAGDGFGIGEYHQLVATDNHVFAFWADGRTNDEDLNIYMAKVNLNDWTLGVQELGPVSQEISISSPYPIPAGDEIFMDLELKQTYRLLASVIGVSGQTLWSGNWQEYAPGTYQLNVPLNQIPGIYLVQIRSDQGYFKAFKFIKQ
jgi:hypothetical protein